ncbi:MAG: peptidylprolyl isomerase [Deltaproteobacteria bacterium]|nr:peptidylprolyl isomerase [Deltaproteobacteria bacterium]
MSVSKSGDRVRVHYTGKLENGTVFDSSRDREPLEFVIGKGEVIPGFEEGVLGMEAGESKKISLSPESGYGQRRDELVVDVERSDLPGHIDPAVGQRLQIKLPNDNVIRVVITFVDESSVTLDANHPLAGETLLFDVEMVEILV